MGIATLCFVFQGDPPLKILLGHKKRGFAQGKIDGFGGKLNPGESALQAAVRELAEESGIVAQPEKMVPMGVINFIFPMNPAWNQEVHVFIAQSWQGEPVESEEMQPEWFPLTGIPFDQMWADSRIWLPSLLAGASIKAEFTYSDDNETVKDYWIQQL
jgi:8-oxo-dGTP diphosphatase